MDVGEVEEVNVVAGIVEGGETAIAITPGQGVVGATVGTTQAVITDEQVVVGATSESAQVANTAGQAAAGAPSGAVPAANSRQSVVFLADDYASLPNDLRRLSPESMAGEISLRNFYFLFVGVYMIFLLLCI